MVLDYVTLEEGFTICIHMTTTYPFLQVESSPGPISPSENERHNLSSGSGNSSAGGSAHLLTTANNMPLSDNNVSTTNMALTNTWDMQAATAESAAVAEQDINVSIFNYLHLLLCDPNKKNGTSLILTFCWQIADGSGCSYRSGRHGRHRQQQRRS